MRILASDEVRTLVHEHGGRLYVWTTGHGCCASSVRFLAADTTRPRAWKARSAPVDAGGFELFLDAGVHGLPDELTLEVKGRKRKIRAFWNGCAYII
jgi:hypothetical protein